MRYLSPPSTCNGPAGSVAPPGDVDLRERLLNLAGIDEAERVRAVREAWETKRQLLGATRIQYFSREGVVTDQREVPDYRTRLEAASALDRMLGVIAPRPDQRVEVVHRLELPAWALPPSSGEEGRIIDIPAQGANP